MAKEEGTRCQRIGCDALFTPDNNPEGSCHYHSGPPLFHDGGKEWSCCKQRSHDFSLFLSIPGYRLQTSYNVPVTADVCEIRYAHLLMLSAMMSSECKVVHI
jgi:hypothetical protein